MPEDVAPRSFALGRTRSTGNEKTQDPPAGRRSAAPKSQRPMAAKGDVDRAVALLDSMYALVADGLDLFGLEETHEKWGTAVPKLRRVNQDSLSASPRLAKSIANMGEGGGATTFFVMHVVILAGIVPVARRELAANIAARPARHAAESNEGPVDWDAYAAQMSEPGSAPQAGGYNAGEYIPGI